MKAISWNVAGKSNNWNELAASGADFALLQEAPCPPDATSTPIETDSAEWRTGNTGNRPWRTAVAKLSNSVMVEWLDPVDLGLSDAKRFSVSMPGSLSAAYVTNLETGIEVLAISAYCVWERPHKRTESRWIYADASAHRIISDISTFVESKHHKNILIAGDFNVLLGYGEHGDKYWAQRYQTVFDRMQAVGFEFCGPQAPFGRQAHPWPKELPEDSANVPTYHTSSQTSETATRQLDFVFASRRLGSAIQVNALNSPSLWRSSDHCQIEITFDI